MRHPSLVFAIAAVAAGLALQAVGHVAAAQVADLVIIGGRVIDPESHLDAVRNVAVSRGQVSAVTAQGVSGRDTLDARGLVVAPGFIDLHQHAQDSSAYLVMVRDGTTTALEMESGTGDVDAWYAARSGRAAINYGVAVGHTAVRGLAFGDSAVYRGAVPTGPAAHDPAGDKELAAIRRGLARGLDQGALGVGVLLADTPGARPWEVIEVFRVAASAPGAPVHVHVRDLDESFWFLDAAEVISAAASTGAPAQLVHLNSSFHEDVPRVLDLIRGARTRGVDVTTEAYPYAEGMMEIESATYDDWTSWPEAKFARYEWPETGERLTRATFERYRRQRGLVVIHPKDSLAAESWIRAALADTLTMIASDGLLSDGRGHPRVAGTHARVLGRYVREAGVLTLPDAIRRMTLAPARRLEKRDPAMKRKGRVSLGADADLVIFDPATVRDRATFREPTLPSAGIVDVIVGGRPVVRAGDLVIGALPGRPVRAPRRNP